MQLLKGFKIIDFTRLLPGPVATHLLAQMGAEVIKIESPERMDYVRFTGPQVDGISILFHQLNHNKSIKIIDYSSPEGKKDALQMISEADVLIEQFRPGAMDAWGLGYEAVKAINPRLVYVSITGYGQANPYANEAGHDLNYLAYAGIMSLMKDEHGKPNVSDTQLADISGAYSAVMAVQAALLQRSRTGTGAYMDVALADAVHPFLALPYALYKGGLDYRQFNMINGKTTVNYSAYQCADGKWLSVAALELKFWNNICDLVNKPAWKREQQLELFIINFPKAEVEQLFKTKSQAEWMELFHGEDVCIAPILEIEELENSAYHQAKQTFEPFETDQGTTLNTIALPFKAK